MTEEGKNIQDFGGGNLRERPFGRPIRRSDTNIKRNTMS
jgi:hypothetical protein